MHFTHHLTKLIFKSMNFIF